MSSPTQRTLAFLRAQGYTAAIVEKWNAFAKIRQDLFGFIDIVAIHPTKGGVLGIQATSTTNMASRRSKIKANETVPTWLRSGNRIWIVGWAKRGPRGKRKVWESKIEEYNHN